MSVTKTVARNTIIQTIGRVVYLITSILMIKVLTGFMGQEGFGQYGVLVDYMGFFGVLVDLGLYLIVIQRINQAKTEAEKTKAVSNILGLRLISAATMFALASSLIFFFPYDHALKQAILLSSAAFLSISLAQLFAGVFQAYLRAEFAAISEVLGRVVALVGVLICAQLKTDIVGVSLTLIAGNGLNFLFSFFMARRFVKFKVSFDWAYYKSILKDAAPLGLTLALTYLYVRQDTIILSLHPGIPGGMSNNEAVGIYKAPYKLLETIQGFPALFLTALFPFMNQYIKDKDQRLYGMYQKAFDFLIAMAVPMVVGTLLLAPRLIAFITSGTGWDRAVITMQILVIAISFSFLNNFSGHVIIAQKDQRKLLIPNLIFLLVNAGLNILLIPIWSYNASAAVTVLTEAMVVVTNFAIIYKTTKWLPSFGVLGKILVCTVVMGVVVYFVDKTGIHFLLTSALAVVVYFALLAKLGGLPEGVRIKDLVKRLRPVVEKGK